MTGQRLFADDTDFIIRSVQNQPFYFFFAVGWIIILFKSTKVYCIPRLCILYVVALLIKECLVFIFNY